MPIQITLSDDLAVQIDQISSDPTQFVVAAVRQRLRAAKGAVQSDEIAQINEIADELNREAADVLEFQAIP